MQVTIGHRLSYKALDRLARDYFVQAWDAHNARRWNEYSLLIGRANFYRDLANKARPL